MEEAKNIRIHLTRSASAMDLKLSHVPKKRTAGHNRNPPVFKPICADAGRRPIVYQLRRTFAVIASALFPGFLVEDISTSGHNAS